MQRRENVGSNQGGDEAFNKHSIPARNTPLWNYTILDEMHIKFIACCSFRMYIFSKPGKYKSAYASRCKFVLWTQPKNLMQ